jgi:hypothetical protein
LLAVREKLGKLDIGVVAKAYGLKVEGYQVFIDTLQQVVDHFGLEPLSDSLKEKIRIFCENKGADNNLFTETI